MGPVISYDGRVSVNCEKQLAHFWTSCRFLYLLSHQRKIRSLNAKCETTNSNNRHASYVLYVFAGDDRERLGVVSFLYSAARSPYFYVKLFSNCKVSTPSARTSCEADVGQCNREREENF